MELKVYIPITVDLADDYLRPLIRRVVESLGPEAEKTAATRGQIVRQAVLDGLFRDLDHLIVDDGSVDLLCDPSGEFSLESNSQPITVRDLAEQLEQYSPTEKETRPPKFFGKKPLSQTEQDQSES